MKYLAFAYWFNNTKVKAEFTVIGFYKDADTAETAALQWHDDTNAGEVDIKVQFLDWTLPKVMADAEYLDTKPKKIVDHNLPNLPF